MLQYHVLGGVRVTRDGEDVHVGGPRQRRLLAGLLVHRNEVVSTDRLVDAVFAGAPTPGAASTMRTYVMRLRRVVEVDGSNSVVETQSPGYVLRVPDDAVDVARFEHLVAEGRACRTRRDPVGAASAFRAALGLWSGDAYAEFDGEAWVVPEAQRLSDLRSVTQEQLVDAELECGLDAELVSRLNVLVDREPLRESFRAQLMVALYRSGRQADALGALRRYRELLARETGLDPSPDLEELAERILAHDENLLRVEPPGRLVRGYRLGERLGTGRDGTVHAARLPGLDRDLVIRVVPADVADRPDVVRSFDTRLRRISALHHDAVVAIDDHWREPGGAWVVLRRMRGGRLRDRIDRRDLSGADVLDMAVRVGSALEAAAGIGVVHGRVIPESVLFDDAGSAHLSDFALGEVGSGAADDVTAFVGLVRAALAARSDPATKVAASTAGVARLADMVAADPPPTLDGLLAELRTGAGDGVPRDTATVNPYKGLRAFEESDAAVFFGREPLVDELVERLGMPGPTGRLTLVVGASGSGKSSAVRAGLVPRVRAGAVPGSDRWLVTTMVPGATPFKELAEGLARVATASVGGPGPPGHMALDPVPVRELAADGGIDVVLHRIVPDDGQVLLVVDQFEELFTLADADTQRCFLDGLRHAVETPDSRLRVVATLRADFYDRPLRFPGFGALVRDATVTVPAMAPAQLEATITGPARHVGLAVEPPLVAELVAAVVDQPAAMPSLQFTLHELASRGDRLDLASYRRLGGVGGAIATRAEELYTSMTDAGDTVRRVFEQLVIIGPEGEPTRRPVPRSELVGLARGRDLDEVVEPWTRARLLNLDRHPDTREPTVEVAHEALLREWPRLRGWVDADRAAIVAIGQLRDAADTWVALDRDPDALHRGTRLDTTLEQLGARVDALPATARAFLAASRAARDDRRRRAAERAIHQEHTTRRLRRQLAALAVAVVVAGAGGLIALDQRGQARAQADLAEAEARRAEEQELVAQGRELAAASVAVVDDDPELGILLALEAIDRSRELDGTVLPEAEGALHRAVATSRILLRVPDLGGSVDLGPDGTVFVTEGPEDSGLVDLRDAQTGATVSSFVGHDADINDVAFSADGSLLATTGDDGLLRVWDPSTGALEAEVAGRGAVWGVSFSPDGSQVAAAWSEQGLVRIRDLTSDAPAVEVRADTWSLGDSTSFSPDGTQLAIAHEPVIVVDTATGEQQNSFEVGPTPFSVAWSPDGRWIASAADEPMVRITSPESPDRQLTLVGHTAPVFELDWDEVGSRLATGSRDGTARVWEVTEGGSDEVAVVSARDGAIGGLALSADGDRLLTGNLAVTATRTWDVGRPVGPRWSTCRRRRRSDRRPPSPRTGSNWS